MKKFKPVLCANCAHMKKAHQANACSYTGEPGCYCQKFVEDDGVIFEVYERPTINFWLTGRDYDNHQFACDQITAIINGWAESLEW